LPVTVALAGNRWRVDRKLAPSLALIVAGIVAINVNLLRNGAVVAGEKPWLGVVFLVLSLALWTWYALANAKFLKANPSIPSQLWASLTGVFTLVFSPALVVGLTGPGATAEAFAGLSASGSWGSYLLWSAAMGLGASWVALWFWNITAHTLPTVLSGQLLASETVFALLYGYLWEKRLPTALETVSMLLLIGGVLMAVRALGRKR
jgi:drug/metabolite transporter (DMT)-like permease